MALIEDWTAIPQGTYRGVLLYPRWKADPDSDFQVATRQTMAKIYVPILRLVMSCDCLVIVQTQDRMVDTVIDMCTRRLCECGANKRLRYQGLFVHSLTEPNLYLAFARGSVRAWNDGERGMPVRRNHQSFLSTLMGSPAIQVDGEAPPASAKMDYTIVL